MVIARLKDGCSRPHYTNDEVEKFQRSLVVVHDREQSPSVLAVDKVLQYCEAQAIWTVQECVVLQQALSGQVLEEKPQEELQSGIFALCLNRV